MKNFVKLIQQVHEERYLKVKNNLINENIPVTFLSLDNTTKSTEIVKKFRTQNWNIKTLVVASDIPPESDLDFDVFTTNEVTKIPHTSRHEYVLVTNFLAARVAKKLLPSSKALLIDNGDRNQYYETFMNHLSELQEVYESLIDEESKKTFCGYWLANIASQPSRIIHSNAAHYLINGFIPKRGAVAIDAGVFYGGTATVFSEMGYKVYGFEMDKKNYELSLKVAKEKNFVVENLGLGSYKHMAHYNPGWGSGSFLTEKGSEKTQITTIDAYAREKNLPSVDFIKMDVEGAELDILKGAKTTIARFKPILALSAYHKVDDFWTLMNFVKSIRPDYEFAMRQSYETPEEEPANFNDERIKYLIYLNLEPDLRNWHECVLFAR
ncbi:MAG: FkbM family methyltransferase [Selenomonadaceae bacterium]|nr:FkbM family methyltransferase [Selenomonadaceae bacterium]